MRLIPKLVESGHKVYCAVRNPERLSLNPDLLKKVKIITIDFLNIQKNNSIPKEIDVVYYLIHSMSSKIDGFSKMEIDCAKNFNHLIRRTYAKQIIFLSGIVNNKNLSKHLESRKNVERILRKNQIKLTVLRAGIIVGSGSASSSSSSSADFPLPFPFRRAFLLSSALRSSSFLVNPAK